MDRPLFCERMGNEAVRQGHWKLVSGYGPAAENGGIATGGPRKGVWELYDTSIDPGETNDLAAQKSEKAAELVSHYEVWGVLLQKGQFVLPIEHLVLARRLRRDVWPPHGLEYLA